MTAHTPTRHQPDTGPYADEKLAYWAQVYAERDVRAYGVLFDTFIQAPEILLARIETGRLTRLDTLIQPGVPTMHHASPEQLHAVLTALRSHIGRAAGITAKALVAEVNAQAKRQMLTERELRFVVTDLRMDGHHVCAHPGTGYYLAETAEELEEAVEFLRHRAMSSLRQIAAMRAVSMPDLLGQLRLPT